MVATSATLSTGGNFQFIASEFGLEKSEYDECQTPSPFDPEHVLLVVPAGIPAPKQQDQHTTAVGRVIERVARDLNGRTMGLFTSYRALNHVYGYLKGKLPGIQILLQGELPKSRIIEMFKKDDRAVILATSSFWQGVDIPGKTLSCVVIDKFPFLPPSDPVLKYMEEKLEAENRSAFFDYSVPKAVIALKQGIGRLIRTEDDVGVIVLCDNRIDTTGYGKQFMRALPAGCFKSETGDLGDAKGFLDDMEKRCLKNASTTI
jgi:ATP-dependent DNA helicase DinG